MGSLTHQSTMSAASTMEITVVIDGDSTSYTCQPGETVLDLKTKIEEAENLRPCSQFLYYNGYHLSQDDVVLGDFLATTKKKLDLSLPVAAGGKKNFMNDSNRDVFLVYGSEHNFQTIKVPKRRNFKVPIKLPTETFGLVYHIEGKEPGTRKYNVEQYLVKEAENFKFITTNGNIEVYADEEKLVMEVATIYDERQSKTVWEKTMQVAKAAYNIGNFVSGIASIVNPVVVVAFNAALDLVAPTEEVSGQVEGTE